MLRSRVGITSNHHKWHLPVVAVVVIIASLLAAVGSTGKLFVAVDSDAAPALWRWLRHAPEDDDTTTGMLRLHGHEFAILCLFDPLGDDGGSRFESIRCMSYFSRSASFFAVFRNFSLFSGDER